MTGKDFRKWRRNLEITQQEVATYCYCDRSTICRWEKGQLDLTEETYLLAMKFINVTINKEQEI